mgnify:CR=1 FL=1
MDDLVRNTEFPEALEFRQLDYFSEGVGINVGGEDRVRSKSGAVVSLGLYIVLGLATYYYLSNFFNTTDPQMQFNARLEPTSNVFSMSSSEVYFYVLFGNPDDKIKEVSGGSEVTGTNYTFTFKDIDEQHFLDHFIHSVDYTEVGYEKPNFNQGTDMIKKVKTFTNKLIRCSDAEWFNRPEYQETLSKDEVVYNRIKTRGFCFKLPADAMISGDSLSQNYSMFSLRIRYCPESRVFDSDELTCQFDLPYQNILLNNNISIAVGVFENSLDSSNKNNPWVYNMNLNLKAVISSKTTALAIVALKKLECITDYGWILEQIKSVWKGSVGQFFVSYSSRVELADSGMQDAIGRKVYGRGRSSSKAPHFELRIVSSRSAVQFSRKYNYLLEAFGNIGAGLSFIIFLVVVVYNWYENYQQSVRVRRCISKSLALPKALRTDNKTKYFCSKDPVAERMKSIDAVTEDALSFEKMSDSVVYSNYIQNTVLPKEIWTLATTVSVMHLINKQEEEGNELKNQQSLAPENRGAVPLDKTPGQPADNVSNSIDVKGKDAVSKNILGGKRNTVGDNFDPLDKEIEPIKKANTVNNPAPMMSARTPASGSLILKSESREEEDLDMQEVITYKKAYERIMNADARIDPRFDRIRRYQINTIEKFFQVFPEFDPKVVFGEDAEDAAAEAPKSFIQRKKTTASKTS